jgi:hypothetical protein
VDAADRPPLFVAVKVNVHWLADVLAARVASYVPLQLTDVGLLPGQSVGVDARKHDDAFDDE